jgi:hypothetical protein
MLEAVAALRLVLQVWTRATHPAEAKQVSEEIARDQAWLAKHRR